MHVMVMSRQPVKADTLCLQFIIWASTSAALRHATVLQSLRLSEDSQCTWQSLCEYFVICVCMCVCTWVRHGDLTAVMGSQLLLKPDSPRSSLLPFSFLRFNTKKKRIFTKSGTKKGLWWLDVMQYLLDVCVGSGCGTDFAAWTGRLVDESAWGTSPLCLLREGNRFKMEWFDLLYYFKHLLTSQTSS